MGSDRSCPWALMWLHGLTHTLRLLRLGDRCVPGTTHWDMFFQGKVFPKLRKRSPQGSSESTSSDKEDDEATDYVFRIIYPSMQSEFGKPPCPWAQGGHLLADPENHPGVWNWRTRGLDSQTSRETWNQEVCILVASVSPQMRTNNYSLPN